MSEVAENTPAQALTSRHKRRRRILIFSIVSLVNVALLAFLLVQLLTPASPPPDPIVGHRAPDFSLTALGSTTEKSTLSLSDFTGRPVVLNFWASWCAPCKEELPLLESAWKQMQAQGKDVIFVGIDYQESSGTAAQFLQQNGVTYPAVLDASGAVASKYDITSLPDTFFINGSGTVVSKVLRELTSQVLTSNLQMIL